MKIKKWKGLLTGIAIVGTITSAISLSANKNNTTQTTTNLGVSKTTVDYSLVEKMMSKLTPKLLSSNSSESKLTPQQEQKVNELQKQYLNLFKTNNYSLEEIQSYMCENFPQYKEEYEKQTTTSYKAYSTYSLIGTNNNESTSTTELQEQVKSLKIQRGILIGACAAASAAAAVFYGLAFWTVCATLPAAAAATTLAATLGILQHKIYKLITKIESITVAGSVVSISVKGEIISIISSVLGYLGIVGSVTGALTLADFSKSTTVIIATVSATCCALTAVLLTIQKILQDW